MPWIQWIYSFNTNTCQSEHQLPVRCATKSWSSHLIPLHTRPGNFQTYELNRSSRMAETWTSRYVFDQTNRTYLKCSLLFCLKGPKILHFGVEIRCGQDFRCRIFFWTLLPVFFSWNLFEGWRGGRLLALGFGSKKRALVSLGFAPSAPMTSDD